MKDQKGNPNQIKPNELRIGNIISYSDGTHHIVSKFDDYKVWFEKVANQHGVKCWVASNIEDVTPIPLTEELLLKLGFERIDSGHSEDHEDYHQWLEKVYPIIGCVYSGDGDYVFCEKFNDQHIYSLHQLQNLYFTITGEELEIKL